MKLIGQNLYKTKLANFSTTVSYWTSTQQSDQYAYMVNLGSDVFEIYGPKDDANGMAVRVVRTVNL